MVRGGQPKRREDPGEAVPEALFGVVRAVVEADATGPPQHLAQRPVAARPPRREAATLQDRGGRSSIAGGGEELPDEPALADPGGAVDEDEARVGPAVASSSAPSRASSSAPRPTNGASSEWRPPTGTRPGGRASMLIAS